MRPLLLRVIRCLPVTVRAARSEGRGLISLKGGNRGRDRYSGALDLWGPRVIGCDVAFVTAR